MVFYFLCGTALSAKLCSVTVTLPPTLIIREDYMQHTCDAFLFVTPAKCAFIIWMAPEWDTHGAFTQQC